MMWILIMITMVLLVLAILAYLTSRVMHFSILLRLVLCCLLYNYQSRGA